MPSKRVAHLGSGDLLVSTEPHGVRHVSASEVALEQLDVVQVVQWFSEALQTQVQASFDVLRARLRFARERLRDGRSARGTFGTVTTLLVTDLEDFTPMLERLGDARAQELIHTHNGLLRTCLKRHRGREVVHTGDGVIAAFRSARDAMGCAIAMQQRFNGYNDRHPSTPLRVRIGLHAGIPLPEEDRLFGTCVNVAVRICSVAPPCDILASDAVLGQVAPDEFCSRDRGSFSLKGIRAPLRLHQLKWHQAPAHALN